MKISKILRIARQQTCIIIFLFLQIFLQSCHTDIPEEKEPAYVFLKGAPDVSTLHCNDDLVNQTLTEIHRFEEQAINSFSRDFTFEEQRSYSEKVHTVILESYALVYDKRQTRIQSVGAKIQRAAQTDYPKVSFQFFVITPKDSSKIENAFCTGSNIYVTADLLDVINSNEVLGFILAHEIAHVLCGHIIDKLQRRYISKTIFGERLSTLSSHLYDLVSTPFGKTDELEADLYGCKLAYEAGYDPEAGIVFFEQLSREKSDKGRILQLLASHPHPEQRIMCIDEYLHQARQRARNPFYKLKKQQ